MGKVRRKRNKLHLEARTNRGPQSSEKVSTSAPTSSSELSIKPKENVFEGLKIDVDALKKNLSDDTQSVRSFKSVKSESGKILSKKDKLKLRREMLLQKFDALREQKIRDAKKKKEGVAADLNPLRDALPSLESLLKSRGNVLLKQKQPKKKRGIEKAKTLKKNQVQGIKVFQQILKNKHFRKDPKLAISQHVKAVLELEKN